MLDRRRCRRTHLGALEQGLGLGLGWVRGQAIHRVPPLDWRRMRR